MKKALILGISSRIGEDIAKKLIQNGFFVIGTYNNNKPFPENNVDLLKLDMSDKDSIQNFIIEMKKYQSIDLIINTISNTLIFDQFEKIEIKEFEEDMKVNFINPVSILKELIPSLNKESNIIFILSEMIDHPQKFYSPYICSKYAILGLIKSLSLELKQKNIRVNGISPGTIDSKFRWNYKRGGKLIQYPISFKEKIIKEDKLTKPKEISEKIIEIINKEEINGENIKIY